MRDLYAGLGPSYARARSADPRIATLLASLLGPPTPGLLADIGAGTGNYANALAGLGWRVAAVEPSASMLSQRAPHPHVHWLAAPAESLPFPNLSLDAAVSVLTLHHVAHLEAALAELTRIVRRGPIAVFTFDPASRSKLWLYDYFPSFAAAHGRFPTLDRLKSLLETAAGAPVREIPFTLPPDLSDRFTASGWRTPALYLDPSARAAMSAFASANPAEISAGLDRLRADLASGLWHARYGAILDQPSFDAGYRFLAVFCPEPPRAAAFPIERARSTDAAPLLDLQRLCYQSEAVLYNDFAIAPLTESLDSIRAEIEAGRVLVLRSNGRLAASVRGLLDHRVCRVARLVVHPRFQRQGLGARLLAAIENLFPEAASFELFTGHLSASNLRLYRRLGYREFARRPVSPSLDFVHLRKRRP